MGKLRPLERQQRCQTVEGQILGQPRLIGQQAGVLLTSLEIFRVDANRNGGLAGEQGEQRPAGRFETWTVAAEVGPPSGRDGGLAQYLAKRAEIQMHLLKRAGRAYRRPRSNAIEAIG